MRTSEDLNAALKRVETTLVKCLLSETARQQFAQGRIARVELEPLALLIKEISAAYVDGEGIGKRPLAPFRSPQEAAAYALYYLPLNFAKIWNLLEELPAAFRTRPLRILDYGAGPGTAGLAAASFFPCPVEVTAIDHSRSMQEIGEKLIREFLQDGAPPHHIVYANDHAAEDRPFDLIIVANMLGESAEDNAVKLTGRLSEMLAPSGALMLLEPALKSNTHRLMRLRDHLLGQRSDFVPLFPCTRADRCPMLALEPENWCHGTLQWEEPRLTQQLDELTGFNKHRLKFAGFIFQRGGELRAGDRVLEEAQKTKRGLAISLCGPDRYGEIIVGRDADEGTKRAISRARQYDLLPRDRNPSAQ